MTARTDAIRVLLVEDSDVYRASLVFLLGRFDDLDVVGAVADGNSALRLARELRPDVVVLDYRLPDRDGSEVVLQVRDDGEGIAPNQLPHVFERFYRGDSARSRDRSGSGIGLTISKAIVDAHGGTIDATSDGPGTGSTFRIALPSPQHMNGHEGSAPSVGPGSPSSLRKT